MSYVILTDSACDLSPEVLSSFGVAIKSLTFRFTDSEKEYDRNTAMGTLKLIVALGYKIEKE